MANFFLLYIFDDFAKFCPCLIISLYDNYVLNDVQTFIILKLKSQQQISMMCSLTLT